MVNWVLRGAVLLWAVFFTILGAQGLLDPATYTETFGIAVDGAAASWRVTIDHDADPVPQPDEVTLTEFSTGVDVAFTRRS